MAKYIVQGGNKLKGAVTVSGSKNAALPILCATILADGPVVLNNVPHIADICAIISILKTIGAKVEFENGSIKIDTEKVKSTYVSNDGKHCMRASILLLGPLLAGFGKVKMEFPGGCILGKRPVDTHLFALEGLGAKIIDDKNNIELSAKKLKGADIVMSELSVTATENVVMAAVLAEGTSIIRLAAAEPHVQDL